MKKHIVSALALIASFQLFAAAPLWLRDARISPDGERIAFCYKGDIYTVSSNGGAATRLTSLPSYEQTPFWSPDGKMIAFASNRFGSSDIFVIPSEGGSPTRLTFNSAAETPLCFSPDGKDVWFSANIQNPATSVQFPRASFTQVYSVPVSGGKSIQILGTPAHAISPARDGSFFVYQDTKGIEDTWRKHHISSVTRDIWRYDVGTGRHTNLTNRPGEDLDPVLAPDGKTVYIISEPSDGNSHPRKEGWKTSLNVYSFTLDNPGELRRISSFDTHPVRFLSLGGGKLCYTWNGEIYTQIPGSQPQKVSVDLTLDEVAVPELKTASGGASGASVSPDGKSVAFIVRGEVFVTSVDYPTTRRITSTPAAESSVSFGADCRTLVYASERTGSSQLYVAKIVRKEDPNFENATLIEEEPFFKDEDFERSSPRFSPDGKKIAFVEDRSRLVVADFSSRKCTTITDGSQWFDLGSPFTFNWSPDGKWLVFEYVSNGRSPYSNIGLASVDGGKITDITGSGYFNVSPSFTYDGNAILFLSNRYGMRSHASWGSQDDVFICFLNRAAYDRYRLSKEDLELQKSGSKKAKKSRKVNVELEGISDRIVRLTPNSSDINGAILSKDGENLYYTSRFEGGYDLWKMNLRKRETKLISKGAGSGRFSADSTGKTIFLLGRSLKKLEGDRLSSIAFSAPLKLDLAAEREYMFDYVCREEKHRFYTEDMHGVDWDGYCAAYRRFLPHISNNYDFTEMLSELLGELNVSHTGSRFRTSPGGESTAKLGLLYDLAYSGEGMKVAEVLKGGPFDRASLKLKAGDVITAVNGVKVTAESDYSLLLGGCVGRKTLVSVKGKGDMVVIPISTSAEGSLLYDRWVKARAADVERLSGGRLGYVHIASMNDGSFRTIYNDILGKFNKCEGIVIDQRFNGGGRLHEDIEVLFSAEKYLTQVVRGRESGDMPSRRWNKPSIMLQCECDYSNAHGTPWVYHFRKLGKLVGTPVPGTMTSVNWQTLLDDSMYFGIPVVGYRTADGNYLENTQLEPDILVYNTPEDIVSGRDAQLEAAVRELLSEL